MPTLQIQVELSVDDLVKAVQKLEDDDFELFMHTIKWVESKRTGSKQRAAAEGTAEDQPSQASEDG